MKRLLFATGNPNKVIEIRRLMKDLAIQIVTMSEVGFNEDIPETGHTLKENAILKAKYLFDKTGENVIAEDTGLEVNAMEGKPGVHTARFAGEAKDPVANMDLLLDKLSNCDDRRAQFHTVIALILDGKLHTFDGIVKGEIGRKKTGTDGFGYDPIFIPEGYSESFAEMDIDLKSSMSHRGRALEKMLKFLNE